MTKELMIGIATQALNIAKHDMERGKFNFLLAAYYDGQPLHRMGDVEAVIVEVLGENWLNNGRAKDAGFGLLREAVQLLPPEALVFACVVNAFTPTDQFQKLPKAEKEKLWKAGHDAHHRAVKAGTLKVCDALMANVQTPELVCLCKQNLPDGERTTDFFEQKGFDGRMKMFGKSVCAK